MPSLDQLSCERQQIRATQNLKAHLPDVDQVRIHNGLKVVRLVCWRIMEESALAGSHQGFVVFSELCIYMRAAIFIGSREEQVFPA